MTSQQLTREPRALSPSWSRIALALALFTLAMGIAFPLAAWIGRSGAIAEGLDPTIGIEAAAIAGGICWGSAGLSLLVLGVAARLSQVPAGVLGGMLLRMGPPMAACFLFVGESSLHARVGVGMLIMGYYLFALVVETLLSVRLVSLANLTGKPGKAESCPSDVVSGA